MSQPQATDRPQAARPNPASTRSPKRRRGTGGRYVVLAVVAVLLAGGGIWVWQQQRASAAAATTQKVTAVNAAIASVEKTVESSGTVVANLDVDIKCRASGEIIELPFDISQNVKKGDLLCQLDPTDEQLNVRSAEAALAQAQAKLEQSKAVLSEAEQALITTRSRNEATLASAKVRATNAQAKADRQRELVAQELGSQEEYETAQTDAATALADQRAAEVAIEELQQQAIAIDSKRQDVKVAEAAVESQQIEYDTAKQQLAYTTVTAPMDGTVSALPVQKGMIVASGTNAVNGGTTILTLSDLSQVFVNATVAEADIGGIRVGQSARVTVDAYPGRVFNGTVARVAVKGVSDANVVTFEVKIEVVDDNKSLLKPLMTANCVIVEASRSNVITVPTSAVQRRGPKSFVTMASGEQREVSVGIQGSDRVEIQSGLADGDAVSPGDPDASSKFRAGSSQSGGRRGPPTPF